jgi:hypothetical protein
MLKKSKASQVAKTCEAFVYATRSALHPPLNRPQQRSEGVGEALHAFVFELGGDFGYEDAEGGQVGQG